MSSPFRPLCVLALLASAASPGRSQSVVVPPETPWVARHWDTTNGLPQNTVAELLQGPNGLLWGATYGGLCRFDGDEWTVFDSATTPGLVDSRITALVNDDRGEILIGSELGLLLRHDAGGFHQIARLPSNGITSLTRLRDGRILVGSATETYVLGADDTLSPLATEAIASAHSATLLPDGDVLVCAVSGLWRVRERTARKLLPTTTWEAVVAGDGTVWLAAEDGLRELRGDQSVPAAIPDAPKRTVIRLLLAADGSLFFGGDREFGRIDLAQRRIDLHLATNAPVNSLMQDDSGGVWIGTNGRGLTRLVACEAIGVPFPPAATATTLASVLADGDDTFLAGTNVGLLRIANGVVETVADVTRQPIYALLRDSTGIWLGLQDGYGRYQAGAFVSHRMPSGTGVVRALGHDPNGRLLAGTEIGVLVLDGEWKPYAPANELQGDWVKMIVPWHDGTTWFVGRNGVLHLGRSGEFLSHLKRGESLPFTEVRAVLPGRGNRVWFATYGHGFVAFDDGRMTTVGPAQGLPDAYVCMAAPFGDQWLVGGNRGPYLLDPRSLDAFIDDGQPRVFGRTLICTRSFVAEANGGVQPSIAVTPRHAMLCGVAGLWHIDAARLRQPAPPPVCVVRPSPAAGNRIERDGEQTRAVLEADRTLLVACSAAEFDDPRGLSFRWRLDGGPWSAPTLGRTVSISAPGEGTFTAEFVAIRGDGTSSAPARLVLVAPPRWWEHPLAPWLAIVGLAGLGFGLFRFGSTRSARHAAHLRQLVDERTVELLQARDSLEQRVAQRTAELRRALEQLDVDHQQRHALERELEQMRRMESLGQLAGSVAHDFNNLLTVVLGNADLLKLSSAAGTDAHEMAGRIMEAAKRGREMTHRLLAVASRQTVVPRRMNLGDALRERVDVLRDLMGSSFRVELHLDGEPLFVLAAPGQIDQILVNLAANARDAIAAGGTLTLSASPGLGVVRLVVADDGPGMTEDVRTRVFEPFFTTRGGRGTGLGLAIVYGITKQLQGDVVVESTPGKGTRFVFVFPVADEADEPSPAAAPPQLRAVEPPTQPPAGGDSPAPRHTPPLGAVGRRVMLIEDEADVRSALRAMLESSGFSVIADVDCGDEGVRRLGEGLQIDAVVSDVRMPGLQGVDLVRALHAIQPGLPILFVSGHTSSSTLLADLAPFGIELVTKPPVRDELRRALERALRRA